MKRNTALPPIFYRWLLTLLFVFVYYSLSFGQGLQTFTYTHTGLDLSNTNATTITSCPSPTATGVNTVSLPVSGVGTLKNDGSNELIEIKLSFYTGRPVNLANMRCYLLAPDGSCVSVYNGQASTTSSSDKLTLNYIFRNNGTCQPKVPKSYTQNDISNANLNASGAAVFFTIDNANSFRDIYNGKDADGIWKFVFCSSSSISKNRPNLLSASLTFGDGSVVQVQDRTGDKGLCANGEGASYWDGTPACFSNIGTKTGSEQTADSKVYPANTIEGCDWNSENNYTNYIKFVANKPNVCLNIQGGSAIIQSIVVQPNPKTLDPCTSPTNVSWNVISCPRDAIYPTNVGTNRAHNHCFTANVGETYYLVVDGSGAGNNTDFVLTGISGLPVILPVELIDFTVNCKDNSYLFEWATGSEHNNSHFTIEHSIDGIDWEFLAQVNGNGTSSVKSNYKYEVRANNSEKINYFRLYQTDFDGTSKLLRTVSLMGCVSNDVEFDILPNPTTGEFTVLFNDYSEIATVQIVDMLGRVLYNNELISTNLALDLEGKRGVFNVIVNYKNQKRAVKKVIVE